MPHLLVKVETTGITLKQFEQWIVFH